MLFECCMVTTLMMYGNASHSRAFFLPPVDEDEDEDETKELDVERLARPG